HEPYVIVTSAEQVEMAVIALVARAVERPVAADMRERRAKQLLGMGMIRAETLLRQPRRRAEPGTQSRRQGPRSSARFLPTAVEQRLERHAVSDPQRPNALWAMDLVRRNRDEVARVGDQHAAKPLHGVAQEQRAHRPGQ